MLLAMDGSFCANSLFLIYKIWILGVLDDNIVWQKKYKMLNKKGRLATGKTILFLNFIRQLFLINEK